MAQFYLQSDCERLHAAKPSSPPAAPELGKKTTGGAEVSVSRPSKHKANAAATQMPLHGANAAELHIVLHITGRQPTRRIMEVSWLQRRLLACNTTLDLLCPAAR